MSFENIIGHEQVKKQIINSLNAGRIAHAHIFTGEDGIGKSVLAKECAREMLGKSQNKQLADMIEFRVPKDRKSIGIENIRALIEETNKKPYEGNKKVIIVHNGDSITEAAQNALLKTIEEPPQGIFIFILCENLGSILDTIKSRCQIHKLQRLSEAEMKKYVDERGFELEASLMKTVIAFSDGIPGRAERFVQDRGFTEIRDVSMDLLMKLGCDSLDEVMEFQTFLMKYKNDWNEVLTCLLSYIRDVFIYKETQNQNLIINMDKLMEISKVSEKFSYNKLNGIVKVMEDTRNKLDRNVNTALVFDSMLFNMQEV